MVYIKFIDGIELMPEAVRIKETDAWRFTVICCKHGKNFVRKRTNKRENP